MTNEEAIEVLKHWDGYFVGHSSDDVNKALMMAIQALEQTRWIPVSEKLPEKDGKYLVTVDEVPLGMPSHTFVCECHYLKSGWDLPIAEVVGKRRVVAWMPLPSPYKGE